MKTDRRTTRLKLPSLTPSSLPPSSQSTNGTGNGAPHSHSTLPPHLPHNRAPEFMRRLLNILESTESWDVGGFEPLDPFDEDREECICIITDPLAKTLYAAMRECQEEIDHLRHPRTPLEQEVYVRARAQLAEQAQTLHCLFSHAVQAAMPDLPASEMAVRAGWKLVRRRDFQMEM